MIESNKEEREEVLHGPRFGRLRVPGAPEREFFIDNLLVRILFIIVMIRWTGLAPWEFEFPFPGSLTSTVLVPGAHTLNPKRKFSLLLTTIEPRVG